MTDEDFSTEALRRLLDDLEPARRAAFDERLARDPATAAEFRRWTDAVAQFACDAAPAEPMTPAAQRATLAAILAGTSGAVQTARTVRPGVAWRRWRWPAAASVLLGLNLWQWAHSNFRGVGHETAKDAAAGRGERTGGAGREAARRAEVQPGPREGDTAFGANATGTRLSPAEEMRRLEKLRTDYANLKRASEALRSEYDGLIRELAQRSLAGQGVGRIAAMELVDAGSYARGDRKGLVNLARGLLTTPGIVAAGPGTPSPAPPTEPPVTPAPEPGETVVTPGSTTTAVGGTGATVTPVPNPPSPDPHAAVPPPPAPNSPPTAQSAPENSADAPYAWSVFDETEGQGYLNLYNLPTVSAEQSLQLWVKSADTGDYQPVGEVPAQFYGGSGSLYYKLADATATPTEILITREPRNPPATKPTGPTILRGP